MSGVYIRRQSMSLKTNWSRPHIVLLSPRDERYGINSKTAQDQSWRRQTVRGAPRHRQLKEVAKDISLPCSISTSASPRYQKELTLYRDEVVQNESALESITSSGQGAGSWEARNMVRRRPPPSFPHALGPISPLSRPNIQANLVRESEKMVRDTAMRLERAAGELGDLLVRAPTPFILIVSLPTDQSDVAELSDIQ